MLFDCIREGGIGQRRSIRITRVLRVEFHCHSVFSKDCLVAPADLVACLSRKGVDRLVVTDHNTIDGGLAAQRLAPERIIVGEEIMTSRGELLAAFVKTRVPPGLSPHETIARLREQAAFISVSHPFDVHRKGSWLEEDLLAILAQVDAIETYNSRCIDPRQNERARRFAAKHGLAGTVGSDAHTCWEVGRSTLWLPDFQNAADLRAVIRRGRGSTRWSPPWVRLSSRYAVLRKRLSAVLDTARAA